MALLAGTLAGDRGIAAVRPDLYQATAPVADRSEGAQAAAFQSALRIVLVRVTGRRAADQDPAFAPLLNEARRFVQQYRAMPDNQLWVAFDSTAIERWLAQNGQPLWGRERPVTFVWLLTAPPAGAIVTRDDAFELKTLIDDEATARGIQLAWPSAADLQTSRLDYAGVNAASAGSLVDWGRRLGGDGVLIGRATNTSAAANVRWTFVLEDHSSEFSGAAEGADHAADAYAAIYAATGRFEPIDIEVDGVGDVQDFANLERYLESVNFIAHVDVQSLNGDAVRFRLTTRGGMEPLQRALAQNGSLEPLDAGEAGVRRYRLRR